MRGGWGSGGGGKKIVNTYQYGGWGGLGGGKPKYGGYHHEQHGGNPHVGGWGS